MKSVRNLSHRLNARRERAALRREHFVVAAPNDMSVILDRYPANRGGVEQSVELRSFMGHQASQLS